MGLFLSAFEIAGMPDPITCAAFNVPSFEDGHDPRQEALRDLGILSRRLGSPTAIYPRGDKGHIIVALGPVDEGPLVGVRGREYRNAGEVELDPRSIEDRRTVVRLVHQGLRDYMASRADFMTVGKNAYANTRPASGEENWFIHRRVAFRVDYPKGLMLAVDVGQMAVDRDPMSEKVTHPIREGGAPQHAILGTPDGVWMVVIERMVGEVTAGDPVVVGPGGERETLVDHYRRLGLYGTADVVDPTDPVVYLRRFIHGRPGREEPHAASLVHVLAGPEDAPPFDPPPSARWKIVQGMANQLGRARLGAHDIHLDVETPVRPEGQGAVPVPPEMLRGATRLDPTDELVGRWDSERRNALKARGMEPGAPRLGPTVLAYEEGVPQGGATTMYSDVRYNLFRYLGTKADPRPVRTMEFSRIAELGPLLTTVNPVPSAVLVVASDPFEGYLTAKATLPGSAVQSLSAATLASRPVHGEDEGDAGYFNAMLWLATALEREAGRAPWTLETEMGADVFVGLSLLGRAHDDGGGDHRRGLVTALSPGEDGILRIGGVVELERGRFEGEPTFQAIARALRPIAEAEGPVPSLVFHREGTIPKQERGAMEDMIADLVGEGLVAEGARVDMVDMNLGHPFRLFQEGLKGPATCRAGSWSVLDDRTALLATTGYPVKTRGTPEVMMVTTRSEVDPGRAVRDIQTLGALDWGGREVRWPVTVWGPRAEMGAARVRPWG
jgi:hypothetical protein